MPLAAPRLDNLCSCYSGLTGMLAALEDGPPSHVPALALFDHEEIGSTTRSSRAPARAERTEQGSMC